MKKIICMILILSFIFSFTACGKNKDVNNKETNTPTTSEVTEGTEGESKETTNGTEPTTGTIAPNGTTVSTESKNETTEGSKGTTPPKSETTPSTGTTPPSTTNPPTTNPPATNPPTTPTTTVKTCNHSNTEVRNKKDATTSSEGYTGDTYCKDCGKLISSGSSIPKIKQTVSVSHDYYDAEMKAFNEINAERIKNGLSPLTWNEGLYAGAKIRAQEHYEFIDLGIGAGPHKRKNGDDFYTAVTETSNYSFSSFCVWGENCGGNSNSGDFVNGWMNSSAHKANMLYNGYSQMAVAIIFARSTYYASCIFVG